MGIVLLVIAGLLLIGGIVAAIIGIKRNLILAVIVGFAVAVVGAGIGFIPFTYTQDAGEAKLKVDTFGNVQGGDTKTGLHYKLPWENTVTFNIRNQPASFVGQGTSDNAGGVPDGAQVTIGSSDGVQSDADITVRYSIKPDAIKDIYTDYKNEEAFRSSLILPDIRSVVRDIGGQFTVLQVYATARTDVQAAISTALEEKWADSGVQVESIAIQQVRPPEATLAKYAELENAKTGVSQAQADLESKTITAQGQIAEAQAQKEANDLLNASLTPAVLEARRIEAMKAGTVYVVPQGSTPFIQTAPGSPAPAPAE